MNKISFKWAFFFILFYLLVIIILSELNILPTWLSLVCYGLFFPAIFFAVRKILNNILNIAKVMATEYDEIVDLRKRLDTNVKCEHCRNIAKSLNHMMINTDKAILEFYKYTVSAEGRSLRVSSSIATVDESITKNAQSAKNIYQSITELVKYISRITQTSSEINSDINKSLDLTKNGSDAMEQAKILMENISNAASSLEEKISELNTGAEKIGVIVSVIDDISEQTALLSLNAAIEAARAGEAGRGFAVVADEIGKLALESSKAANNTKELIGISMEEINKGNSIAAGAMDSLKESVDAVSRVNEMIQETAENAAVQAEKMKHLRTGIKEISHGIQDNSAVSQETSATSEELASQAGILNTMVQKFELFQQTY